MGFYLSQNSLECATITAKKLYLLYYMLYITYQNWLSLRHVDILLAQSRIKPGVK